MQVANLALAFLLELAGLAAFCYWGFAVPDGLTPKLLFGLGLPILAAVLWGVFASPKATVVLPGPATVAFQLVWFGAAAVVLGLAGRVTLAVVLAVLVTVNRVLQWVWHQ